MAGKILLVGATGTNGRELVPRLAQAGIPFRIMARDTQRATATFPGAEIVAGNLDVPSSLPPALEGVTRAWITIGASPEMVQRYGAFTAAAKRAGLQHLVKFSAFGADPGSRSIILRQHAAADAAVRNSGVPFTLLRPNSFYQNLLWSIGSIKSDGAFYLPSGQARIAGIDVRDIADATVALFTQDGHAGQAYELTGPAAWTYDEAAAAIGTIVSRPVRYVPVPPETAKQAMLGMGLSPWLAAALAEIQAVFQTESFDRVTPDAARLLGRPPRPLEAFLADFAAAFRTGAAA